MKSALLALVLLLAPPPENLLPNGGFEKGLEGWRVENESGTLKVDLDAKERAEGKSSAHVVATAAEGNSNDRLTADVKRLPPAGKKVIVSARVKTQGPQNTYIKFFVFDAKDNTLVEDCDVFKFTANSKWKAVDREFEIPKDAVRAEVRFCMFKGGEAWLDDVKVLGSAGAAREKTATKEDDIPTQDLRAGKDENRRYLFHGPRKGAKEPRDGWKVAVVMPGGDGSAEFQGFVKNILANSLGDDWVVAEPVAVKWTEKQEIVWPTKGSPVEGMKFTTEEFVDSVIDDIAATRKIDRGFVFSLSWSSSGPAAYAIALREKTPITGSFVAMAVFFPNQLPPIANAKGRAFYLYQSPEDEVTRFFHAEKARDALKKEGATVEFQKYEGGHGWHGDMFGDIRRGFEWLEKNRAK